MVVPGVLQAAVEEEILLLIGIAYHALMRKVGLVIVCIIFQGSRWSRLICQEIANYGQEEAAGKLYLHEIPPCLVAHASEIDMIVTAVLPKAMVCNSVLALPEVQHTETVAEGQHPRTMGIVKLCIDVQVFS